MRCVRGPRARCRCGSVYVRACACARARTTDGANPSEWTESRHDHQLTRSGGGIGQNAEQRRQKGGKHSGWMDEYSRGARPRNEQPTHIIIRTQPTGSPLPLHTASPRHPQTQPRVSPDCTVPGTPMGAVAGAPWEERGRR